MTLPSSDAPPNYHHVMESFFDHLRTSLLVQPFDEHSVSHYSLPRVKRATRRRLRNDQQVKDETTLREIEERIKDTEVKQFIAQHFNGATPQEQEYLLDRINNEFEGHRVSYSWGDSHEPSLTTLLKLGLPGIRKLRAKESRDKTFKSSIRIIWAIIKGLALVVIVLSIYTQLQNSFQALVVSIVIAIYALVAAQVSHSYAYFDSTIMKANAQFSDLREVLGKPLDLETKALMQQAWKDAGDRRARVTIYHFTLGIIELIVIWKIMRAIGWI